MTTLASGVYAWLPLGQRVLTKVAQIVREEMDAAGAQEMTLPIAQPLELWSFESSPYCRMTRAMLTELELPYLLHNVGRKSPRRAAFIARSGKMQVPWLSDPNTGTELFESKAIIDYLDQTYGLQGK